MNNSQIQLFKRNRISILKVFCRNYPFTISELLDLKSIPVKIDSYEEYIAFSLNTPASIVQNWQSNLDAIKADGTFETIWQKWYGNVEIP